VGLSFGRYPFKLRNSVILGNVGSGVGAGPIDDLGTGAPLGDGGFDYGYNTLQALDGGSPNTVVGLSGFGTADAALQAAGNTFSGPRDCSRPDAGMLGPNDISVVQGTVNVANCTY
jgi:hypothetical protein